MFDTDRRRLRRIERLVVALAEKLDISIEIGLADLALEIQDMASTADILAQTDALLAKVQENTDATAAIAAYVDGLKAQLTDLQQQLADAIAGGADAAELTAISENIAAVTNAMDADTVAEKALVNTPAAPEPTE